MLFPKLTGANDLAVIAGAVFIVVGCTSDVAHHGTRNLRLYLSMRRSALAAGFGGLSASHTDASS